MEGSHVWVFRAQEHDVKALSTSTTLRLDYIKLQFQLLFCAGVEYGVSS
jgi:hypothetical protein